MSDYQGFNNHPLTYPRTGGNSFTKFDTDLGKRESRKVANNTYCQRRDDGSIAIRLHTTDVVTYHADGTVTLRSGGWETATTKDRFNNFGPDGIVVYSDKGRWTVYRLPYSSNLAAPFIDGMTFDNSSPESFTESTEPYRSAGYDLERSRKATETRIKGFLALVTPEAVASALEGVGGDCLCCKIESQSIEERGKRFQAFGGDHIASHVAEGYVHATLLANAMGWAGYKPYIYLPGAARETREGDTQWMTKQVKRSLRRYLKVRLQNMTCADWSAIDTEVNENA